MSPDSPNKKNSNPKEQETFTSLLQEFLDVFTWSYKYMLRIDRDVAKHKIPLCPDAKSVK